MGLKWFGGSKGGQISPFKWIGGLGGLLILREKGEAAMERDQIVHFIGYSSVECLCSDREKSVPGKNRIPFC